MTTTTALAEPSSRNIEKKIRRMARSLELTAYKSRRDGSWTFCDNRGTPQDYGLNDKQAIDRLEYLLSQVTEPTPEEKEAAAKMAKRIRRMARSLELTATMGRKSRGIWSEKWIFCDLYNGYLRSSQDGLNDEEAIRFLLNYDK